MVTILNDSRPYWSDEVIVFLITTIRNTPYMWDKTHKDYSIRYLKHNFWKNLRWTLEKRFKLRVYTNELARKWLNLSSYYRMQQKAIYDAKARGAQPEEIKRLEGWKFLHQLKFLPIATYDKNTVDVSRNNSNTEILFHWLIETIIILKGGKPLRQCPLGGVGGEHNEDSWRAQTHQHLYGIH